MAKNSQTVVLFLLVAILKVALVLGVFYWFGQEKFMWGDSVTYRDLAQKVVLGEGYGDPNRTPLYVFLLSGLMSFSDHAILFMALAQALASAGIALLVWRIGAPLIGSHSAIAAALFIVFEPLNAIFNLLIMPETFLLLFLLFFIYFFLRYIKTHARYDLVVSVFFLALTVWTKPVTTYLFIVPLFIMIIQRRLQDAILFLVIVSLLVTPWVIHNRIVFGEYFISAHGDASVCGYLLTSIFSTEYGTDPSNMDQNLFPESFKNARLRCSSTISGLKIAVFEHPRSFAKTFILSSLSYVTNEGYSVLFQKAPGESIKAHHNYLTPAVFADANWQRHIREAAREIGIQKLAIIAVGKLFWLLVALFALCGVYRLFYDPSRRDAAVFLALIVVYFVFVSVISTGYGVGARLRYPIEPILLIFAFVGAKKLSTDSR